MKRFGLRSLTECPLVVGETILRQTQPKVVRLLYPPLKYLQRINSSHVLTLWVLSLSFLVVSCFGRRLTHGSQYQTSN